MKTYIFDQGKERWGMYQLKTKVLHWLNWNKIISGRHNFLKTLLAKSLLNL